MSMLDDAEVMVLEDLSKGLDTYSGNTLTEKGCYVGADNLLLTRKHPVTIGGLTRLSATAAPNSETILYSVPFTLVGSATEHLVYTSGGTWYRLAANVYTQLRTGLSTAPTYLTHAPFRSRMVLANGVDAVQGYDGTTLIPIGTKLVSNMANTPTPAGTWAGGTNETTTIREGTQARSIDRVGAGDTTITLTYTATQNFLTGPQSGDPDFDAAANGDTLRAQINVTAGAANITRVRFLFRTGAGADFRTLDATGLSAGWNALSITRNSAASTGAPNWASIASLDIILTTTGNANVIVDDVLFQYGTNPVPTANIAVMYNNFLILSDQTADRVRVSYSAVNQIDSFPTANFTRINAGGYSLEVGDRVTAAKVYSSVVVIGKPRSIHALSGTPGDITVDVATTETGIDGHNSMVESPFALFYLYGNNFHAFRLTGRELIGNRIHHSLGSVDLANPQYHTAMRHDESHTIRWSLRLTGQTQNTLQIVYDWNSNAWTSEVLYRVAHYFPTITSGLRELCAVRYDGFLQRVDTGTDFDGTAIASRLLLPWVAGPRRTPEDIPAVVRWLGMIVLLDGNTDVTIDYRVADVPQEMAGAFTGAEGSPLAAGTPNAEKGYVGFGNAVGRFVQARLRTTSGSMEVHPPVFFYYLPITGRRGP